MAGGADQGDEDIISGINITPLVDVVLVLLIILMVTAKQLVQQDAIAMDLPSAVSGETQPTVPTELGISLEADGTLHLNITQNNEQTLAQTVVTQAQLREHARAAHEADPEARAVLSADPAASHGSVIAVIDLLRVESVNRFAFSTRQPSELPSNEGAQPVEEE
jgi:biopolymer transport protein ExbD